MELSEKLGSCSVDDFRRDCVRFAEHVSRTRPRELNELAQSLAMLLHDQPALSCRDGRAALIDEICGAWPHTRFISADVMRLLLRVILRKCGGNALPMHASASEPSNRRINMLHKSRSSPSLMHLPVAADCFSQQTNTSEVLPAEIPSSDARLLQYILRALCQHCEASPQPMRAGRHVDAKLGALPRTTQLELQDPSPPSCDLMPMPRMAGKPVARDVANANDRIALELEDLSIKMSSVSVDSQLIAGAIEQTTQSCGLISTGRATRPVEIHNMAEGDSSDPDVEADDSFDWCYHDITPRALQARQDLCDSKQVDVILTKGNCRSRGRSLPARPQNIRDDRLIDQNLQVVHRVPCWQAADRPDIGTQHILQECLQSQRQLHQECSHLRMNQMLVMESLQQSVRALAVVQAGINDERVARQEEREDRELLRKQLSELQQSQRELQKSIGELCAQGQQKRAAEMIAKNVLLTDSIGALAQPDTSRRRRSKDDRRISPHPTPSAVPDQSEHRLLGMSGQPSRHCSQSDSRTSSPTRSVAAVGQNDRKGTSGQPRQSRRGNVCKVNQRRAAPPVDPEKDSSGVPKVGSFI